MFKLHERNIVFLFCITLLIVFSACQSKETEESSEPVLNDLPQILEQKELCVITLESSLSYFTDGDNIMGYEYTLCSDYAESLGVDLRWIVASNLNQMRQLLLEGKGDVIVYRMPMSKENKSLMAFANNVQKTYPVLIQSLQDTITDATGLIGRQVYTRKHSRYWHLLNNLNEELGGGIDIVEVDSLNIDRLIRCVADGVLPLTVADYEVALLNSSFVPHFSSSVALGLEQEYAWAVRKTSPELLASINDWYEPHRRYYEKLKNRKQHLKNYFGESVSQRVGQISPFDSLFQIYAPQIGWDWRLLASLAYHESRFNPQVVSYAGAVGLMQLMPRTAERFGVDSTMIFNPEYNIAASVQYIKRLDGYFRKIKDEQERKKFILASYNSGPAHIFDARALAKKYGQNPDIWFNSVENYLLLKNQEEYYNDSVCQHGYFRGNHTVDYVRDVLNTYRIYSGIK